MFDLNVKGNELRRRRLLRGFNNEQLAAHLAEIGYPVTASMLGKVEKGTRKPSAKLFSFICQALQCKQEDLLDDVA